MIQLRSHEVAMGEARVSDESDGVMTTFVGSCVALCLFESSKKVGGLAHIMLPEAGGNTTSHTTNGKYADQAIDYLLNTMQQKGAKLNKIKAKIAGGAQIFKTETGNGLFTIGERNIESIKKILDKHGIQVLGEETGKTYGRWVKFDLQNGAVDIKSKRGNTIL
ncbi:MAG: chemotaxis protein CheD [Nitrosopumilaceae archaeon]|nr:chemotaxis protein CheD [Nitrosopumilaceae archaeon]